MIMNAQKECGPHFNSEVLLAVWICAGRDPQMVRLMMCLKRQTQDAAFSVELTRRLAAQIQSYRQLAMLQAVKHAEDRVMQAVSLGLLTVSVTHLASQIGLTRETCYRALRTLVRQGQLIQTGRGQYRPAPVR